MTAAAPLVLVTGAGGFIGSVVVESLRERGFHVLAGTRREARLDGEVRCDLDKPDEIAAALNGVDLVIHAAYGDVGRMISQNANLLAAMASRDVPRLISLSSIAVYGGATGIVDETTPAEGALDGYASAKVACEAAARGWVDAAVGRGALMMRPGIVYGTASPFWIGKLGERIRLGAWGEFGRAGEGVAALIHVEDLAQMIVAAAVNPSPGYAVINAVGPDTPSWNVYFRSLAAKLGAPPPPRWDAGRIAMKQKVATVAKIWRRLGLPGARAASFAPTAGEIALFSRAARYSTDAAAAMGLKARLGLAEGLARTKV